MNIVMYGINETDTARLAARYGFSICRSIEEASAPHNLIVIKPIEDPAMRETLYGEMERNADSVHSVITTTRSDLHWLYYTARPDMLFTVNIPSGDNDEQFYELQRIIESQLGLLSAHEE